MAKSGIAVSASAEAALRTFADSKDYYIKVSVQDENFVVGQSVSSASPTTAFASLKAELPKSEPAYYIFRLTAGQYTGKFVVVFYCPDSCKVRDRMVYASSVASLKKGFGDDKFGNPDTYRISKADEADWKAFCASREEGDARELMTNEEIYRKEAEKDNVGALSGKVGAIVGMQVKLKDDSSKAGLEAFKDKKIQALILRLDPETEMLEEVERGSIAFDSLKERFDKKEPRYVLHHFRHENDGQQAEATIFLYYCPDAAKPKLKMFYSSAKAMMLTLFEHLGITITKKLEASDPADVTSQFALEELYPKAAVKKTFAKPKAAGKPGGRGMIGGTKFVASPTSPASGDE